MRLFRGPPGYELVFSITYGDWRRSNIISTSICDVIHHGWRIIQNVDRLAGELILEKPMIETRHCSKIDSDCRASQEYVHKWLNYLLLFRF